MILTNLTLDGNGVPDLYPLPVGSMAPYFSGIDQYGESFSLESIKEKGNAVLFFYSGYWCNYCSLKLTQFQKDIEELKNAGANVAVITQDGEEFANRSLQQTGFSVPVLVDFNHIIMKSYKVAYGTDTLAKHSNEIGVNNESFNSTMADVLSIPATYIINQKGIIDFVHFNPMNKDHMSTEEVRQKLKI